jgi:molybdopterin molybdotransferase
MIQFRKALDQIQAAVQTMPVEKLRIEGAAGRILRQNIRADRAFPPLDRIMMDGFALRGCTSSMTDDRHRRVKHASQNPKP